MTVTQAELNSFHNFALAKLQDNSEGMSWVELVSLWRLENPTAEDRAEIDQAIQEGLDDIAAGRCLPAERGMDELRRKHDIPRE